jgi:hypothetical protein
MSSLISIHSNPYQPFQSFWMAGYECADHLNAFGIRVDLLEQTRHLQRIQEDYAALKEFNIETVREGIRWSKVEVKPYEYDWRAVKSMIRAAQLNNIQQVWDICHFGFPDDLTPLHPMFARRFAHLCMDFVKMYRTIEPDKPLIVVPINEVSFLSWLGGDVRGTSPYCVKLGFEVKYALMKAFIEGAQAMKKIDRNIIIQTTEPLVNFVPADINDEQQVIDAANFTDYQYQSVDMLTGRICPELGGHEGLLDILGFNFYYNNQWIHGKNEFLPWFNDNNDPRWRSFSDLLISAYSRFSKPFVVSETSHCNDHRPNWLEYVSKEMSKVIELGYPLKGACLYPIINRPDWDQLGDWHLAGLWDLKVDNNNFGNERILYQPYAEELFLAQKRINNSFLRLSETPVIMGISEDRVA